MMRSKMVRTKISTHKTSTQVLICFVIDYRKIGTDEKQISKFRYPTKGNSGFVICT
jgi:hypothetical protein